MNEVMKRINDVKSTCWSSTSVSDTASDGTGKTDWSSDRWSSIHQFVVSKSDARSENKNRERTWVAGSWNETKCL